MAGPLPAEASRDRKAIRPIAVLQLVPMVAQRRRVESQVPEAEARNKVLQSARAAGLPRVEARPGRKATQPIAVLQLVPTAAQRPRAELKVPEAEVRNKVPQSARAAGPSRAEV